MGRKKKAKGHDSLHLQPDLLAVPESAQLTILRGCTFFDTALQNPMFAMACSALNNLFRQERKRGGMKPPNICVPRDCANIEDALAKVPVNGTIAVCQENMKVNKNLTLVGIHGPEKTKMIQCLVRHDVQATVAGFTIASIFQTGYDLDDHEFWSIPTGAAVNIEKGNPVFQDCTIINAGQGVRVCGSQAQGTFIRCDIHSNTKGVEIDNGNPMFAECTIRNNEFGGVKVCDGDPMFTKCKIADNKENGVSVERQGHGHFLRCEISGNSRFGVATYGKFDGTNPRLQDTSFRGNNTDNYSEVVGDHVIDPTRKAEPDHWNHWEALRSGKMYDSPFRKKEK